MHGGRHRFDLRAPDTYQVLYLQFVSPFLRRPAHLAGLLTKILISCRPRAVDLVVVLYRPFALN